MTSNGISGACIKNQQQNLNINEILLLMENFTDLEIFTESHITQNADQILKNIMKHINLLESVKSHDEDESNRIWDAFAQHCIIINILIGAIAEMKSRLEKAYEDYVNRYSTQEDDEEYNIEIYEVVDAEDAEDVKETRHAAPPDKENDSFETTSLPDISSVQDSRKCIECGLILKNRCSLKPHYDRVHRKVKSKSCNVCGRQFACSGDLTRHIRTHNGDRPFQCPHCPQTFISSGDMNKHIRRHNRDLVPIPRNFVCQICGASFDLSHSLRRHTKKHETVDLPEFTCEFCSKNFYRKDQYMEHLKRHMGLLAFECSICCKKFCDRKNRKKHELTHKKGPFTCDYCNKQLETKTEIIEHFEKFHNK